jgi:type 1 glutamine amidotransferase
VGFTHTYKRIRRKGESMFCRFDRAAIIGGVLACVLLTIPCGRAAAESPLRVLILSADADHGGRATTHALRHILADAGRFDVRVCEATAGLTARTFEGFDLLVDNGAGLVPGGETEKAIAEAVSAGKGLVVAHGALGTPSAPAFWPAIAGEGPLPPVRFLDVTITMTEHPIVTGMNGRFRTADTVPRGTAVRPDSVTIATAVEAGSGGNREPALLASRSGAGRVVWMALGHDTSAMHEPQTMALFTRACEWAATGKVTLPADLRPSRPARDAVRALLITGGHDHEAAFYSLFVGHDDIDWLPVDTAANAFKKDLRDKYDVLIMYDFTRELDETGRKNLRDFAEAGKGIVVLHHALLNFQKWNWWSEEVVGGRYRLQREGQAPSSSVKDNQSIFVSPAGEHPVLRGIGPFHIIDEAYKNLYMSPRIKPLLTTDNPTSDTNLAWIGPCATSRVVAIQLGHGHSAFGHPAYRTLVHNAVLWAAGKTH